MKKSKAAQELIYIVSECAGILPPDEQFPAYCIGVRKKNAFNMLEKLKESFIDIFVLYDTIDYRVNTLLRSENCIIWDLI